MLKEYPRYNRGGVEKALNTLPKSEQRVITEFGKYCEIGAGATKVRDMKRNVIVFRIALKKDFNKLTLQDLRDYLVLLNKSDLSIYGKNDIKAHLKKFLRWKFEDWSKRFSEFRDIKTANGFNEEKINGNTLLSKEDIEKMVNQEKSYYWKSFFLTQYEGGLRTQEARFLKWKDINFNTEGDISEVNIYSTKNKKARVVYIKDATFHLKRLKETAKETSDYVFPSPNDPNKPVNKYHVSRWFREHSERVLGRKVWAYMLRHSRASELYLNADISNKVAQKFMGHRKEMSDIYTHMSKKDIQEAMSKSVYGNKDLPPEKKHELEKEIDKLKKQSEKQEKDSKEFQEYVDWYHVQTWEKQEKFDMMYKGLIGNLTKAMKFVDSKNSKLGREIREDMEKTVIKLQNIPKVKAR